MGQAAKLPTGSERSAGRYSLEARALKAGAQMLGEAFTCVLCSAKTEPLLNEISIGMNIYRIKVIRLKDWNADELLDNMEEVLYVLAIKFLKRAELKDLEEAIKMTELGKMLYDDGWNAGVTQGITQGITKGLKDAVLVCLSDLGTLPAKVNNRILSATDEKELKAWLKAAKGAESIEQFCRDSGLDA